jgi:hypothetical protein
MRCLRLDLLFFRLCLLAAMASDPVGRLRQLQMIVA